MGNGSSDHCSFINLHFLNLNRLNIWSIVQQTNNSPKIMLLQAISRWMFSRNAATDIILHCSEHSGNRGLVFMSNSLGYICQYGNDTEKLKPALI